MEIGRSLREAREARKLTLQDVEEETKIRCKYLDAMENEQFDVLPDPVYARAFLKNYARFLKLDVDAVLEEYSKNNSQEIVAENPDRHQEEKIKINIPFSLGNWRYFVAAIVVVFLAFSVYSGVKGMSTNLSEKADVKKTDQVKAVPGAGEQTKAPEGQNATGQQLAPAVNLVLDVKKDRSWVQVTVDGSQEFQGTLPAGQSKNFTGKEKISITLGNAGAVEVHLNGQNLGFLGGIGDVINKEFTLQTRG